MDKCCASSRTTCGRPTLTPEGPNATDLAPCAASLPVASPSQHSFQLLPRPILLAKVLKMIPMTYRDQACMKLAIIVEGMVSMNDTSAWKRLFASVLVASGCLHSVATTGP